MVCGDEMLYQAVAVGWVQCVVQISSMADHSQWCHRAIDADRYHWVRVSTYTHHTYQV